MSLIWKQNHYCPKYTVITADSLLVSNLFDMMTDIDHITNSPRSLLNLGSQVDTSDCNNLHTNQLHKITTVHILNLLITITEKLSRAPL